MSKRERQTITTLLTILLPLASFFGGYFINDYVEFLRVPGGVNTVLAGGEDLSLLREAWQLVEAHYIDDTPDNQQLNYAAIRGSLASLNDPYTLFLEPVVRQEEEISLRGNFGGIGAQVLRNEAGEIVLVPIPGNPAEAAGVVEGDVLLAVDGVSLTAEMSTAEVAQMVRGEIDTEVVLTVRHPEADAAVEITVIRDDILIPSVLTRPLPDTPTIGYIQLTRFSGESTREMREALTMLQEQGARQMILDLRGNGGGLLEAAIDVADLFIAEGDLLYQESKRDGERVYSATAETTAADVPLVVLVDGGTASAAEILAGALQDHQRAVLVGTQTFGKGSVQWIYDLSDGSSIHITSARWYTPNRAQIDQRGLTPNQLIEPTAEGSTDGRDEILEHAIQLLEKDES